MKRYIGNTGEVIIVEEDRTGRQNNRTANRANSRDTRSAGSNISDTPNTYTSNTANSTGTTGSIFGNLFGSSRSGISPLPFGLDAGDIAILALLFFLYSESGDEEFLIILACFAFGILTK